MRDPIVEEVRKIREEHAARFNYDLDAIFEEYKRLQHKRGWPLVKLDPKRSLKNGNRDPGQ